MHSRLDYCNSIFYGLSDRSIARLQSIQNRAAKTIVGGLKFDHVSPVLNRIHWLTVDKRILFKICVMMFKCVKGVAPKYLIDKCRQKRSVLVGCQLRSVASNSLIVPPTQLKIDTRNFAVFGPVVWNSLPRSLRKPELTFPVFKKNLKTFLFSLD